MSISMDAQQMAPEAEASEQFAVRDDATLAWCMRKVATAKSRIEEQTATAQKIIAKLEEELSAVGEWLDKETREDVATIDRMEAFAIDYLRWLQRDDLTAGREPKVKSKATPWGKVKSRELPAEIDRDEPILLAWARKNGYMIQPPAPEPRLDWAQLKKDAVVHDDGERLKLPRTGELIPGVVVHPAKRHYEIEVAP